MRTDSIPTATSRESRRVLGELLRTQRSRVIGAAVALIIGTVAQLVTIRLLGTIVDVVTRDGAASTIDRYGAVITVAVVVSAVSIYIGRLLLAYIVESSMHRLRQDALQSTLHLPLATVETAGVSEPLSRMTNDVATVSDAMHNTFPMIASGVLTFGLASIALIVTSPIIALGALPGFIVLAISIQQYLKASSSAYGTGRKASADIIRELHEIAEGARTIRTFRRQDKWLQQVRASGEYDWTTNWVTTRTRCVLYSGTNIARVVSLIVSLGVGAVAYTQGWATLGTVSAAALFVNQLYAPIGDLLDSLDNLQQATAGGARIAGLTLIKPDDNDFEDAPDGGAVTLAEVTFAYHGARDVLHGVDLDVADGERVAVVGPSGAGKSTIAKLVAGIYNPSAGKITVGGLPASSGVAASEHKTVAMVTQESHVFSGTLASNLRLANGDADDDDLWSSLGAVGAHDWVEHLPASLETHIGRDGYPLTLLQTQQLALARILLADPTVVILDEATASFDSDSARGVERSFAAVFEGRTVVTIAHRLDVAATADRVIVVDKGTIAAGTHDTLLADHAGYRTMWNHWSRRRQA